MQSKMQKGLTRASATSLDLNEKQARMQTHVALRPRPRSCWIEVPGIGPNHPTSNNTEYVLFSTFFIR
jgi:hypothetical protein